MSKYPESAIVHISETLHIDSVFLVQCLDESVVEIHENNGSWMLNNATALKLRQLERICHVLEVDLPAALHVLRLTQRVAELESEVQRLRARS